MNYSIEELLPVVESLMKKYTSNESSSVTYETARRLMEAVLYCMNECNNDGKELASSEKTDSALVYQRGLDLIVQKVYKAKKIYEDIVENFQDYQCENCRDTIIKGIPEFFIRYDPKFNPRDHIITLDYPTLISVNNLYGADAVYQYLFNIKMEWNFLNAFDTVYIESLLERVVSPYRSLYFDNISYDTLLTALGCLIAEKSIGRLELDKDDVVQIEEYFENDGEEEIEEKVRMLIKLLFTRLFPNDTEMKRYFLKISSDYAVRIMNGMRYHSISGVFHGKNII